MSKPSKAHLTFFKTQLAKRTNFSESDVDEALVSELRKRFMDHFNLFETSKVDSIVNINVIRALVRSNFTTATSLTVVVRSTDDTEEIDDDQTNNRSAGAFIANTKSTLDNLMPGVDHTDLLHSLFKKAKTHLNKYSAKKNTASTSKLESLQRQLAEKKTGP